MIVNNWSSYPYDIGCESGKVQNLSVFRYNLLFFRTVPIIITKGFVWKIAISKYYAQH